MFILFAIYKDETVHLKFMARYLPHGQMVTAAMKLKEVCPLEEKL